MTSHCLFTAFLVLIPQYQPFQSAFGDTKKLHQKAASKRITDTFSSLSFVLLLTLVGTSLYWERKDTVVAAAVVVVVAAAAVVVGGGSESETVSTCC
jgi:hypothetical protein